MPPPMNYCVIVLKKMTAHSPMPQAKSLLLNLMGEERESKNRLENKQQFLRLMNVLNQVLMCVYDSKKVTIESESAKECLEKIKQSVMESVKD
ncbi:hypothetical protein [Coxiella burnetii]|uniref:hypothetical protein n=3 Tax=Coxiella burnetii TaxID=777 RepID=UPI0012D30502